MDTIRTIVAVWFLVGAAVLAGWTLIDIRSSIINHGLPVGFAVLHWFARLPVAMLLFGVLWPFGIGMTVYAHYVEPRATDERKRKKS